VIRTTAAIVVLASLALSPSARAEPTPVVMVAPKHHEELARRTAEAVAAQLADLPVSFDVEWVDDLEPSMRSQVGAAREVSARLGSTAVFWVDLSLPEQLFLYIAEAEGGRILVRSIRSEGEDLEARLETVAVIIRGAVKAILAGGKIGVEAPPPPPPAPPEPTRALDVFGAYVLTLYSSEVMLLHGARLGLSARLSGWARAFLAYRLQLPLEVKDRYVELDLSPHPLELGLIGRFRFGDWFVDAGAGLLVDVVTVDVTALDDNVLTRSVSHRWLFGASPLIAFGRSLGRTVSLSLAVSADVMFNEKWYAVQTPDGPKTVLRPWRVRPVFHLGASFTLL
jgi:hypothetical protein